MWLLSFLPDWIIYAIPLIGAVGLIAAIFLSYIPFISKYNFPVKIISFLVLVVGVWLVGGISNEAKWQARVKEMEAKIKVAEEKSKKANKQLAEAYKQKNNIIKQQQVILKERVKQVQKKIDAECKIDPEALSILNEAAKQPRGKK